MSHTDLRMAMREVRRTGREVDLMVEMIESGRYTIEDGQRIREALIASWAKNTGIHFAWIRTPVADSISRVTHLWVELESQRSVFRSSCGLIMLATSHELVTEHLGASKLKGLRACRACTSPTRANRGAPIRFAELYDRTGKRVPA